MAKVNPIHLQKFLKGVDYPAQKEDLLKVAEKNGAEKEVQQALEELPEMEFDTPAEVNKQLGKLD